MPSDLDPVPSVLDASVVTPLARATDFLYTGDHPLQSGVPTGAIELRRAAVLRGRVLGQDGKPLGGVEIKIVAHAEFGSTQSRSDGAFDKRVGVSVTAFVTSRRLSSGIGLSAVPTIGTTSYV